MRTGEFWEAGSSLPSPAQTQQKEDVTRIIFMSHTDFKVRILRIALTSLCLQGKLYTPTDICISKVSIPRSFL